PPACIKSAAPKTASLKKKPLPYIGRYDAVIDCENQLVLPAEVHEMLGSPRARVLYVMPGTEPCLCVYTETGLHKYLGNVASAGQPSDNPERDRRVFYSKLRRVEVRADGSMDLPADLVRQLNLDGMPVLIVGVEDHLEIWDRCCWNEYSGV